ncbi:MAG: hypothetical protein ACREL6_03145, partial [Gemmatimonadales bacterium]
MLTLEQVRQHRRRRPPPSLKQQYQEYVLQRIEGYKNSLPRGELLRLGDDAVKELHATSQGQFVLTEVLMLDSVDRIIMKRLSIRPYRRWRTQFLALRKAQREPTHWGVAPDHPATRMLGRIEAGDHVLAVGASCEECACLMAAHDAAVTFIAGDLGLVERVESRASIESLGSEFDAIVIQPGYWFPPLEPAELVLLDAAILTGLEPDRRQEMIRDVQRATAAGGVHVLVPGRNGGLTPDAILSYYPGWV